jgi:predicted lactoylglutathione lyase
MAQTIFVNLPVADLGRARRFYVALGFGIDERFTGEQSVCAVVSPEIFLMLLTRERFADFAPRPVGDPARETSVLVALSRESRADVEAFMAAGLGAGGTDTGQVQEHADAMYGRALSDPDGNVIEVMWMDVGRMVPTLPDEMDLAVEA